MEKYREIMNTLRMPRVRRSQQIMKTTHITIPTAMQRLSSRRGSCTTVREMQFVAVTTKDGHVFYVLINYSAENGEDNVYFLNRVMIMTSMPCCFTAGDESDDERETITPCAGSCSSIGSGTGRVQVDTATAVPETEEITPDEMAEGEHIRSTAQYDEPE